MLCVPEIDMMDEMASQEFKVLLERGDQQELLEHRGHLDPGVGEPLTSGGAEPLAQTHRELNWFMLAGLQEATSEILGEELTTYA